MSGRRTEAVSVLLTMFLVSYMYIPENTYCSNNNRSLSIFFAFSFCHFIERQMVEIQVKQSKLLLIFLQFFLLQENWLLMPLPCI